MGTALVTLVAFPKGGYASLFGNRYKSDGDLGNDLWWAIKMCRFVPGELDPYVPGLERLPLEAPIPLLSEPASQGDEVGNHPGREGGEVS